MNDLDRACHDESAWQMPKYPTSPEELLALATAEVVNALRSLAETGACPINPPIFGALVNLGAFEFGAHHVLLAIEAARSQSAPDAHLEAAYDGRYECGE